MRESDPVPVETRMRVMAVFLSPSRDEPGGQGGSVLGGLLAPLRLPARLVHAMDSLAEAAGEVAPIKAELIRVREQTEPLAELMPAVQRIDRRTERLAELVAVVERIRDQAEPLTELIPELERIIGELGTRIEAMRDMVGGLESEESHLNTTVGQLVGELGELHETVTGRQNDVQRVTDHLPNGRGPVQKIRAVLADSDD